MQSRFSLINIPNFITSLNLFSGCLAIFFGIEGEVGYASLAIIAGAVFDFFDGLTARALHISGPIGKELDSLADVVTFGVAPSVLCYHILASDMPFARLPLLAFVMAAFSALRLAKFNCDERQSLSFIGLPTPANALLWIGLVYLNELGLIPSPYFVCLIEALCCYLLISEVPMFSLKLKPGHNGFSENRTRYIFLALTALILALTACLSAEWFCAAPAFIITLYIVLSLLDNIKK